MGFWYLVSMLLKGIYMYSYHAQTDYKNTSINTILNKYIYCQNIMVQN